MSHLLGVSLRNEINHSVTKSIEREEEEEQQHIGSWERMLYG